MIMRMRLIALPALACLVLSGFTLSACTTEKCGPSPKLLATWPGHTTTIYECGGFGPMVGAPAGAAGATPEIILQVGQQVRLTESGDWSGYHVSAPVSDEPNVLRLVEGATGKVVGVFVAVSPGYANVGARGDVCGNVVCAFTEVEVAGGSTGPASRPPPSSDS
jgi:hypothetical protein